jgi:hypothetical protein
MDTINGEAEIMKIALEAVQGNRLAMEQNATNSKLD